MSVDTLFNVSNDEQQPGQWTTEQQSSLSCKLLLRLPSVRRFNFSGQQQPVKAMLDTC